MVDAGTAAFLAALRAAGGKPIPEQTPEEFREGVRGASAALAIAPEAMHQVIDRTIPGPGGGIPVRIYTPRPLPTGAVLPVVVLYHGAGWVGGDLDTHDAIARYYAKHADVIVVAVHYRLAPEHPFPAAVEDADAAVQWAASHGSEFGGDGSRLAVTGDSAGGNLAAVVCQLALARREPRIAYQALLYPATDLDPAGNYPSRAAFGSGEYFLSNADVDWFRQRYLGGTGDVHDPRVSPLAAPDLAGLPPALIVTAGHDLLRDEGKAYADRLQAAGVAVEYRCFDETVHAFVSFAALIPAAAEALAHVASRLRQALSQ